jgi:hypothetical protein
MRKVPVIIDHGDVVFERYDHTVTSPSLVVVVVVVV